jgi:hypothetical protein
MERTLQMTISFFVALLAVGLLVLLVSRALW